MDAIYSSFGNYMAQLGQLSYFQMMKGLNKAYHEENIFEVRGQPLEANDYKLIADIYNACRFMVASYGHLMVHGFLGEGSFKDRLLCVYTLKSKEQYMKALMNHLNITFDDIFYVDFGNKETVSDNNVRFYTPALFVIRDQIHKTINLVIRGTWCIEDFVTDFTAGPYPFKNGSIHKGMGIVADRLLQDRQLYMRIKMVLECYPDYAFHIIGHSMGASVAALLTLAWKEDPYLKTKHLFAYCFAPCPVLSENLVPSSMDNIISIVNSDDIIPRLSRTTLNHFCEHIINLGTDSSLHFDELHDHSTTPIEKSSSTEVPTAPTADQNPSSEPIPDSTIYATTLYLPGKIYYMNYYLDDYEMKCDQNEDNLDPSQKKESLYNVKPLTMSSLLPSVRTPENMILVKNEEFPQEITISPFMLTSHFPNNYEKLLYSILQKYAHKNV